MPRPPAWLVRLLLIPLQIYLFVQVWRVWGAWPTLGVFLLVGLLAARAGRPPWLREAFFPWSAQRWERRRHWYQAILLIGALASWWFAWGPQPWLAIAMVASLAKTAFR